MPTSNINLTLDDMSTAGGVSTLNNTLNKLSGLVAGDGEAVRIIDGFGTPEGNVSASIGSLYMRKDGGALTGIYVKESGTGGTGWINLISMTNANDADGAVILEGDGALPALDGSALINLPTQDPVGFSTWVDKSSSYDTQQATTDGFVLSNSSSDPKIHGFTDASNPPTTEVVTCIAWQSSAYLSFLMPVNKDNYWKLTQDNSSISQVYWIPLEEQ